MLKSRHYLQSVFFTISLLALSPSAYALNGIPPTLKVAGKDLVLNGAGVKTKFFTLHTLQAYIYPKKTTMPSPLLWLIQQWQFA